MRRLAATHDSRESVSPYLRDARDTVNVIITFNTGAHHTASGHTKITLPPPEPHISRRAYMHSPQRTISHSPQLNGTALWPHIHFPTISHFIIGQRVGQSVSWSHLCGVEADVQHDVADSHKNYDEVKRWFCGSDNGTWIRVDVLLL